MWEYLKMESAEQDDSDRARLRFLRTALIRDRSYWVWSYVEAGGVECYLWFWIDEDGASLRGYSETHGLTIDQFLMADYYEEF